MGILNTDVERLIGAANALDGIRDETLSALGRYLGTNQDLTGTGFIGQAALASLTTTEDVTTTGRNVSARFENVIQQMRNGAAEYERMNADNAAGFGGVQA
jgi:hypothetical protein